MSNIWIIAKMSILENSRKQVFHVLCLMLLAVIVGSTLLSMLTDGVKLKILKDLCMTSILFGGAVLSIALGSGSIPNDVESRTIHPIVARPVNRVQYVIGKFFGTFITVMLGLLAMSVVFSILIVSYQGSFDNYLIPALGFALLEVAVISAVATAISTAASPAVTSALTFLVYIFGTIKIGFLGNTIEHSTNAVSKFVLGIFYHVLPNLECFNFKTALVHHENIPGSYMLQVGIYGVLYIAFALLIGSAYFARREI